jgi:hypothetical protein
MNILKKADRKLITFRRNLRGMDSSTINMLLDDYYDSPGETFTADEYKILLAEARFRRLI